MATPSSQGLGDLALVWDAARAVADVQILDGDYAVDQGLLTATLLSLFLDRRADVDETPPSGDPTDRRGWWGDQFAATPGDKIGSGLWLLAREVITSTTSTRAQGIIRTALAWMLEDRVVSQIDVETEFRGRVLLIGITYRRPGRDPVSFRFAHTFPG